MTRAVLVLIVFASCATEDPQPSWRYYPCMLSGRDCDFIAPPLPDAVCSTSAEAATERMGRAIAAHEGIVCVATCSDDPPVGIPETCAEP